jgi:hypothetical protein
MAGPEERGKLAGVSVGGILIVIGIVVAIAWSVVVGGIVALLGVVAFGAFARPGLSK